MSSFLLRKFIKDHSVHLAAVSLSSYSNSQPSALLFSFCFCLLWHFQSIQTSWFAESPSIWICLIVCLISDIRSYYFVKLVSLDFFLHKNILPYGFNICFFFLAMLRSLWDLSSLTRHWTQGPRQWELKVLTTEPPRNSLTSFEMILSWITYYQDGCKIVIFGFVIPSPFIHWCSSLKKHFPFSFKTLFRISLMVQCLRLHASSAGGTSLTPGQGTKILHVAQRHPPTQKKSLKILLKVSILMDLYFIQWTKCVVFITDFVLKSLSQSGHWKPFQDPSVLSHHFSSTSLLSRLLWTLPVSVQGPRCRSLGSGVSGLGQFLAAGCHSF